MRIAFWSCLVFALGGTASAQIVKIRFKTPEIARQYKKHTVEVNGEMVVLCETKSGFTFEDGGRVRTAQTTEVYLPDRDDPGAVPYDVDGEGNRTPKKRQRDGILSITGAHIEQVAGYMQQTSLYALAREYDQRRGRIEELRDERDNHDKGSRDWFHAHRQMVNSMEQLHQWMASTLFDEAAADLVKQVEKEKKTIARDALEERARRGQESIHVLPTPDALVRTAAELSDGEISFKVQESEHVRLTYFQKYPDARIGDLLRLAETMIDGFRAHCVDPYVDADFTDAIPDALFVEFYFGPDHRKTHEFMLERYYGISWGGNREQRVQAASGRYRRNAPPQYLQYWNVEEHSDLEGIIAHGLGHVLASIHYNQMREKDPPNWLEEAVGYYFSLEYLGQNSVTCREFVEDSYGSRNMAEGDKAILVGMRELYNRLALTAGPALDTLIVRRLYEMKDPDFAKAWSFFDYLTHEGGVAGQRWLREGCTLYQETMAFQSAWRGVSEKLFGVENEDVFRVLDNRWKEFAQNFQKDAGPKRRR